MNKRTIITKDSVTIRLSETASVPEGPARGITHSGASTSDVLPYLSDKQLEGELISLYMRSNERDQLIVMEVFNRYKRVRRRLTLAEEFILNLEGRYLTTVHKELLSEPPSGLDRREEPF